MSDGYVYVKYEKLSDAVKDWEDGEQIYTRKGESDWHIQHNLVAQFWTSSEYAKRVEVKND